MALDSVSQLIGNQKMGRNRLVYVNEGWTPQGIARKNWAIGNKMCAWCGKQLPKHHRVYCSRKCSLQFLEDPRYHKKMLLWTRIRAEVLWEHKTCQICGVNHSSEVDHIKEIARGGDPFDKSNLQAVCSRCHKRKTALFLSKHALGKRQSRLGLRGRSDEPAIATMQQQIDDFRPS